MPRNKIPDWLVAPFILLICISCVIIAVEYNILLFEDFFGVLMLNLLWFFLFAFIMALADFHKHKPAKINEYWVVAKSVLQDGVEIFLKGGTYCNLLMMFSDVFLDTKVDYGSFLIFLFLYFLLELAYRGNIMKQKGKQLL